MAYKIYCKFLTSDSFESLNCFKETNQFHKTAVSLKFANTIHYDTLWYSIYGSSMKIFNAKVLNVTSPSGKKSTCNFDSNVYRRSIELFSFVDYSQLKSMGVKCKFFWKAKKGKSGSYSVLWRAILRLQN